MNYRPSLSDMTDWFNLIDISICCMSSIEVWERGVLVVEPLTPEREDGGSISTSAVLCP